MSKQDNKMIVPDNEFRCPETIFMSENLCQCMKLTKHRGDHKYNVAVGNHTIASDGQADKCVIVDLRWHIA